MRQARFFILITTLILGSISFYLSLILLTHSYEDISHLQDITYNNDAYPLATNFTQLQYFVAQVVSTLTTGVACLALVSWYYQKQSAIRSEMAALTAEGCSALNSVAATWRNLTKRERTTSIILLSGILLIRAFYLLSYPLGEDELNSYHLFASKGILYVSSYYPIPNNHVLYNTICYLANKVNHNFYWASRTPAFFISLIGTFTTYLLLLRFTNFTVAAFAIFLFCLSPYGLEYSFVGRGYFLLFCFVSLGFFSTIGLATSQCKNRLYWFVLAASSILGIYTVPTYLYPFLSSLFILAIYFLWYRQWQNITRLFLTTCLAILGVLLLYFPIFCVSGLHAVIGNNYVAPPTNNFAWNDFIPYYHYIEGIIIGQERVGLWIDLAAVVLLALIYYTANYKSTFSIAPLLLSYLFTPFVITAIQRVFAPARTLSYRVFFIYILLGIIYNSFQSSILKLSKRSNLVAIVTIIIGYGSYQIYYLEKRAKPFRAKNQQIAATYQWLINKQAQRILVQAEQYPLFLHHYAQQSAKPLVINTKVKAGVTYDYIVVQDKLKSPTLMPSAPFEVYTNGVVRIFSGPIR